MLVSQSSIQLQLMQSCRIGRKDSQIAFLHLVIGLARQVIALFVYCIKVGTTTRGQLIAYLKRTFPHGDGDHQLGGVHPTVCLEVGLYRATAFPMHSQFLRLLR